MICGEIRSMTVDHGLDDFLPLGSNFLLIIFYYQSGLCLEWGSLSLMNTVELLLDRKVADLMTVGNKT